MDIQSLLFIPGYAVSSLSDGSTEYFVAGAPRSNHSGQVIVYTLDGRKQVTIIDSERGKQVLVRPAQTVPPLNTLSDRRLLS